MANKLTMADEEVQLFEAPTGLFSLKEVTYTPVAPRMKDPFTVKGKVDLLNLPFLAAVWVIATVTYPKQWWEVIGSPKIALGTIAWFGNFSITFPKGFDREGDYSLDIAAYLGPTMAVSAGPITSVSMAIPPFPPVTTWPTQTFTVAGEAPPPPAVGFQFGQPVADPHDVSAGSVVTITCPVISTCDQTQTVVVKCSIYEGGRLWIAGALLMTISSPSTQIAPGESKDFIFKYTATTVTSGISKRDVSVDVYIGADKVAGHQFDGVFYVTKAVPPGWFPADTECARATFSVLVKEPTAPPGWFPANAECARATFNVLVKEPTAPPGWFPAYAECARASFSILVKEPTAPPGWFPANTECARANFSITIAGTPTAFDFFVIPTGQDELFPGAKDAMYYYWDPGQNKFIGDGKWYPLTGYGKITGATQPGGYMAIFLRRDTEVSPQYSSQTFNPVSGGYYLVFLKDGYVYG